MTTTHWVVGGIVLASVLSGVPRAAIAQPAPAPTFDESVPAGSNYDKAGDGDGDTI